MAASRGQSRAIPRLSDPERRAWGGFLRAHADLITQLDRELQAAHGLPLRSYDVLIQLAMAPGQALRMSELADAVVLSRSGLTRLVDRLVGDGFVERQACPTDRRGSLAVLTPEGRRRVREATATHIDGVRRQFLSRLSAADLDAMASMWERLAERPEGSS